MFSVKKEENIFLEIFCHWGIFTKWNSKTKFEVPNIKPLPTKQYEAQAV
jgi:hypothetical protein